MTKPTSVLLYIFLVTGCIHNDRAGNNLQQSATPATLDNFDTLIIDRKAAVFYSPDSIQIEKRKKEIGEEGFYTGADDYLNYLQISQDFLDSVKLPIIDTKDKKYLKFIVDDKSQTVIRLDTLPELWGIYFFKPGKKEKLVDMLIIYEEYNSYFR